MTLIFFSCDRETRRKFDVEKVSNTVLKYTVDRFWEFMPELSEGHKESDLFNIINIPMLVSLFFIKSWEKKIMLF